MSGAGRNPAAYLNPAQHAALAWHVATDNDITFTQVEAGANIAIADGKFGNTGFVSVLRNNLGQSPFETCSNELLDARPGHALGLGDDQVGRCETIMWNPPNVMYDVCGIHTPQGRDIAWVNQLY